MIICVIKVNAVCMILPAPGARQLPLKQLQLTQRALDIPGHAYLPDHVPARGSWKCVARVHLCCGILENRPVNVFVC